MIIYRYVKLKSATRKWEDLLNSQFRLHFFKVLQSIMLGSRVDDVKIVYQHSLIPSQLEELFSNHGSCCSKNCMANLINTCNNNIINSSSSSRSYSIVSVLNSAITEQHLVMFPLMKPPFFPTNNENNIVDIYKLPDTPEALICAAYLIWRDGGKKTCLLLLVFVF